MHRIKIGSFLNFSSILILQNSYFFNIGNFCPMYNRVKQYLELSFYIGIILYAIPGLIFNSIFYFAYIVYLLINLITIKSNILAIKFLLLHLLMLNKY